MMSTSLEKTLYDAKFPVGPTSSNPGPMLLKHDTTAEKLVVIEKPSIETSKKLIPMIMT
mgnify:CR=1 FL=1